MNKRNLWKGKKNDMKNALKKGANSSSGITLIALVITIIVLLILAGVVIATLSGENGILNRAGQASDNSKRASCIEQAQLAVLEAQARADGNVSESAIRTALATSFSNSSTVDITDKSATLTPDETKYNATNWTTITVGEVLGTIATEEETPAGGSKRAQITPAPTGETYSAGDEVTFGGEQFFVISDDGTTVKLLAKYFLSKTADEQTTAIATTDDYGMTFSKTNYWSSAFTSSPFDLQSSEMLTLLESQTGETTANNAILKAQAYGTAKGVTGRLMTYAEADAIQNGSDSDMKYILWGKWTDGTQPTYTYWNWWLGDAYSSNYKDNIWNVRRNNCVINIGSSGTASCGVRPVLEIS